MRSLSLLLSIVLHVGLVLAIIFWPESSSKVDLSKPVVRVRLVSLAVKAKVGAKKVRSSKPRKEKKQVKKKPAPKPKPKPKPKPEPKPTPKPEPVKAEPKVSPKPESKPKPDATPISPKKAATPASPKPVKEEKTERKPKPEPKPDTKKKAEPKPAKPKPKKEPSSEDVLRDALADTKKAVKQQEKSDEDALEQELEELKGEVALDDPELVNALKDLASEGGEGEVASVEDLYALAVSKIIKEKWRFPPLAVREPLVCSVWLSIGRNGEILDARVLASSGKPQFDSSTLRAIADTGKLPKPPRADIDEVTINFNSHEQ